ncbi:CoA-binding protein, partial [Streptomyces sp. PRKS01-65]
MGETVAILGASNNPSRYAYLAFRKLREHGHRPIPVNPAMKELEGVPAVARLEDIHEVVDTLTMYVGQARSTPLTKEILALKPGRVIFNPGSENPVLEAELTRAGIPYEHACTLVLL